MNRTGRLSTAASWQPMWRLARENAFGNVLGVRKYGVLTCDILRGAVRQSSSPQVPMGQSDVSERATHKESRASGGKQIGNARVLRSAGHRLSEDRPAKFYFS